MFIRCIILLVILIAAINGVSGQKVRGLDPCITSYSVKVDPDTVTRFIFSDRIYPVSEIPNVGIISNYGFKTKLYQVRWMPVATRDSSIRFFITKRTAYERGLIPQKPDTAAPIQCTFFGRHFSAIKLHSEKRKNLMVYEKRSGCQMIFIVRLKRYSDARQVLAQLEKLFDH